MNINDAWEKVSEFHEAFSHPVSKTPVLIEQERVRARYNWMLEEIDEFIEASTITDQADAMIDLIYFALGTLVEMGIKPQKLFDIVHNANMSKLWPNSEQRYNGEGKTIKPPNWVDPYERLEKVINDMIK